MHLLASIHPLVAIRTSMLLLTPLMFFGCGGGKGNKSATSISSSAMTVVSSTSMMSSPGISSSISSTNVSTSIVSRSSVASSTQTSSSLSQSATSSSISSVANQDQLTDAKNQFSTGINQLFYVFSNPAQPQVLHFLPKQMTLTGLPGLASVQRTNKVSSLLAAFLDLSDTDWTSANQITFSSRYSLDVDLQKLQQESEAAGYTLLADIKVASPVISFEHRYTTSVPAERVQIQCKNLTLLVEGRSVTLHDCNLMDRDGIIAAQTINNIGGFRYEALSFDPNAISSNKSLRGTLAIDYTLPGTREFDQVLLTADGDLQRSWQLNVNWPLTQTSVNTTNIRINWNSLLADLNTRVSAGATNWDDTAINNFIASAISSGTLVLSESTELTPALGSVVANYLKQELFVAIYTNGSESPLTWAPRLRFNNLSQPNSQTLTLRYFDADLPLLSHINLRCLTAPDAQNNIYRATTCE